jgi:hypothetical protein
VERRAEEVARLKLLAAPLFNFLLVIGDNNSRHEKKKKFKGGRKYHGME